MYVTKQKSAIICVLKENSEKLLTPEKIINLLKAKGESVGKATLYRYLDNLVLTKEIRKSYNPEINSFEYQLCHGDCSNHLHLKCKKCGKVIHLECKETEEFLEHISLEHVFLIDHFSSTIYGLCPECRG